MPIQTRIARENLSEKETNMAPETSGTVTNDGNARCSPIISPITPAFLLVLIWWFTKDDSRPGLGEVGLGASPKFDISQVE